MLHPSLQFINPQHFEWVALVGKHQDDGVLDQETKHCYKRKDNKRELPQKERRSRFSRFTCIVTLEFGSGIPRSIRGSKEWSTWSAKNGKQQIIKEKEWLGNYGTALLRNNTWLLKLSFWSCNNKQNCLCIIVK